MERVYLDMYSLKRPFDDQRQPRVREEATAVAGIIARAEAGEIALVRSPAHLVENDANPREDRRLAAALRLVTMFATSVVSGDLDQRLMSREHAPGGRWCPGPCDAAAPDARRSTGSWCRRGRGGCPSGP